MAKRGICSIPGCGKPHQARTWCSQHYYRWIKHGSPHHKLHANGEETRAALRSALTSETDECVHWPFSIGHGGYTTMHYGGKVDRVHRIVCRLAHGDPTKERKLACHTCNNSSCVNPRHLRWGSSRENMLDSVKAGTRPCGDQVQSSKLKEDDIRAIRASTASRAEVAAKYGINLVYVSAIRTRKVWKHVA